MAWNDIERSAIKHVGELITWIRLPAPSHLGNLRHPLNEAQQQRLGRHDVLMIPIDGQGTLSYDQITMTIAPLRPTTVLLMHCDFPEPAQLFMQLIKGTVPVQPMREQTLQLTRALLPGAREVMVVGDRECERQSTATGRHIPL